MSHSDSNSDLLCGYLQLQVIAENSHRFLAMAQQLPKNAGWSSSSLQNGYRGSSILRNKVRCRFNVLLQPGIFNWDEKTQGLVLGAFFYGYTTTQVMAGTLAQRVGGKLLMLFGVFWTAFLTLLTPILTTLGGFWAIFFVRLLEGMGEVRTGETSALTQICRLHPPSAVLAVGRCRCRSVRRIVLYCIETDKDIKKRFFIFSYFLFFFILGRAVD